MLRRRSGAPSRAARALLAALACVACASVHSHADADAVHQPSAGLATAAAAPALAPGTGRLELAPALDLEESGLCTYTWQPPAAAQPAAEDANTSVPLPRPLSWHLNRGGGAHARGLVAPQGFHRVDVGAGKDATSFFFQARPASLISPHTRADAAATPQFCGAMAFTPASPPPACFESGRDACPAECVDANAPVQLRGVCGNACSALVAGPPAAAPGRCHALARAAGNVTVGPLNASRPADGLLFAFSAGDAAGCPAASGGRTLRVAVCCAPGGPLAPALAPASVRAPDDANSCLWETVMTHPAACPLPDPSAPPADVASPPVLYWAKERRYIERHVGSDEVFEHFLLRMRNDGGGALLASLFALRDANFVRFTPPALSLGPGEVGYVDVKVPSRFVTDAAEIKIQTNGGEGSFFLIRDDFPSTRHPEMLPSSRRHTQAVALLALGAAAAACSAGVAAPRARRHMLRAAGSEHGCDDDGEGGLTGRRHRRRGGCGAGASSATSAGGGVATEEEDAELAAAYATSAGLAEMEAGGGAEGAGSGGRGGACGAQGEDDVAGLCRAAERAAAKAAALEAGAAEMGATPVHAVVAAAAAASSSSGAASEEVVAAAASAHELASSPGGGTAVSAERQLLCVVCLAAPKDTVLVPCRHLSTCLACTRRLAAAPQPLTCPLCRRQATDFLQLFL